MAQLDDIVLKLAANSRPFREAMCKAVQATADFARALEEVGRRQLKAARRCQRQERARRQAMRHRDQRAARRARRASR